MSQKVNIPMLRKAVEWVEWQAELPEEEREWDQSQWCGTTMCVAGYVALANGWKLHSTGLIHKDGSVRVVSEVATSILGLTYPEDDLLFVGTIVETNDDRSHDVAETAREVRRVAEQIAGEKL